MTQKYECEFVGGFKSPVVIAGRSNEYLIGTAEREDGYRRTVFIDMDGAAHPDPWITAVRPVTPAQACRAYRMPILAEVGK